MSIWGAVMGHANMVMHGAGWMEGGLVASFEKMILDAEILQGMGEFMQPLVVDADSLAFDAIKEVGPGGHFFGVGHTLERYETAFYAPRRWKGALYWAWWRNIGVTPTKTSMSPRPIPQQCVHSKPLND